MTTKIHQRYQSEQVLLNHDNTPALGFKKWLFQFKKDDTAIGDLARDTAQDKSFPALRASRKGHGSKGYWHLVHMNACDPAVETFQDAWLWYKHGCTYEQYLRRIKKENPDIDAQSTSQLLKILSKYYDEPWGADERGEEQEQ